MNSAYKPGTVAMVRFNGSTQRAFYDDTGDWTLAEGTVAWNEAHPEPDEPTAADLSDIEPMVCLRLTLNDADALTRGARVVDTASRADAELMRRIADAIRKQSPEPPPPPWTVRISPSKDCGRIAYLYYGDRLDGVMYGEPAASHMQAVADALNAAEVDQ